jgi:alkanesulfonate monooxygenase SsuD/methylene tetrahydromethanopterin reductase-like flavin-dependent oxidoreductase (luciferase family)
VKIGLMLFLANERRTYAKRPYEAIRSVALKAEADGYDSIWLADHLLYRTPGQPTRGIWECWTILAALAEATQRVELGTLVLAMSFRNPAILAKMATALDEVSAGRLILGVGAGWNEPEYQAFGLPFDHRVSRFEEGLRILKPMLREGWVDVEGSYHWARDAEDLPRGPRDAGPPLLIGAEGPRMLRLTAQYADLWNIGYLGVPETLAEPRARIEAACGDVGRDPRTLGITVLIGLWFPDLEPTKPAFLDQPLTGSPEDIAAAMRGYEELGVEHLMFQCEPYVPEAIERLTDALRLYRGAAKAADPEGRRPLN